MADFTIKQSDRLPSLVATLEDADGAAVNLSSGVTSVTFSLRLRRNRQVVVTNAAAVIVTAATGIVRYDWADGDTAEAGQYEGEFSVNYTSGLTLSFPNGDWIDVLVVDEIA